MEEETNPKAEPEIDSEQIILEEAFHITHGDHRELQKRILAVAYTLATESGEGFHPVDGAIALGLEQVLRGIAKEVGMLGRLLHKLERETGRLREGEEE